MKRCLIGCLCLVLLVGLAACSRSGKTPFDRTDSSDSIGDSSSSVTTGTTLPSSGNSTTSTTKSSYDDVTVKWDDLFGSDTTTSKSTGSTTTASTTTTTVVPVATSTKVVAGVRLPSKGFSLDGKMQVAKASISGNVVTVVFHNATAKYESDRDTSTCTYVCLDKDGKELATGTVSPGRIRAGKDGEPLTVTVPAGTAEFKFTSFDIEYWSDGFH